jgi:hypothetical protein
VLTAESDCCAEALSEIPKKCVYEKSKKCTDVQKIRKSEAQKLRTSENQNITKSATKIRQPLPLRQGHSGCEVRFSLLVSPS